MSETRIVEKDGLIVEVDLCCGEVPEVTACEDFERGGVYIKTGEAMIRCKVCNKVTFKWSRRSR